MSLLYNRASLVSQPHINDTSTSTTNNILLTQSISHYTTLQLIDNVLNSIQTNKTITDNDYYTLFITYGNRLRASLEIIDNNDIECVISNTTQQYYFRVMSSGSSRYPYTCTYEHCTCLDYMNNVVLGTRIHCKHQLACMIGYALSKIKKSFKNDDIWCIDLINDKNKEYKQQQQQQQNTLRTAYVQ